MDSSPFLNRRVAFVGKLGGLTKREATQMVREHGGTPVDKPQAEVDLIIIGADHLPVDDPMELLNSDQRLRVDAGKVELLQETELWEKLGLVEHQQHVAQLYTPAMLADLLKVPVRNIRRWHRMGLIHPVRVVHRLPYFDFQEVRTARQLAGWLASGASLTTIQKQLQDLAQWVPDDERSIAQLNVIVEGRQLLLRQDEGLVEPGGQLRMDFDALADRAEPMESTVFQVPIGHSNAITDSSPDSWTQEQMTQQALELEDQGQLQEAIEWYRTILAKFGPQAEVHFQLAELLYREGEVQAARERYYAAIEMDDDYVEARANLGCVLSETGRPDLAVAAFRGALARHDDYPDVHYHLARTLDDLGEAERASMHWERFLELAPGSPWSDEARERLEANS